MASSPLFSVVTLEKFVFDRLAFETLFYDRSHFQKPTFDKSAVLKLLSYWSAVYESLSPIGQVPDVRAAGLRYRPIQLRQQARL